MTTSQYEEEIRKLYIEMYDFLLSYAIGILRNRTLAEEAVQETFTIACKKPEQLFDCGNPSGWLVNTLKLVIRNIKRNQEQTYRILVTYTSIKGQVEATFSKDSVKMEIEMEDVAGTEEYQLLKELAIDQKSHLEMAKARGISVNACKKRVQRAKEFLKKYFQ